MEKILISAGAVYGRLDDNKLVGNRTRGIWATRFAERLAESKSRSYEVILVVPDIMQYKVPASLKSPLCEGDYIGGAKRVSFDRFTVIEHQGFDDYRRICREYAPQVDVAIMAAAVVNWIPKDPFKGKMPTDGIPGETVQNIPFILAPRVIDEMKVLNPKLTLIGCKLTVGASLEELKSAAYKTLIHSRANAIVANDLKNGFKTKRILYPDGSWVPFENDFAHMYDELEALIEDEYFETEVVTSSRNYYPAAEDIFDYLVEQHRSDFVKRIDGADRVFGAIAVKTSDGNYLVSPREKGQAFSSKDAVLVQDRGDFNKGRVYTYGGKASLNAPLLIRFLQGHPRTLAIVHLHKQLEDVPTVDYAPPGTLRDNLRAIPDLKLNTSWQAFNIRGHGCFFRVFEVPPFKISSHPAL